MLNKDSAAEQPIPAATRKVCPMMSGRVAMAERISMTAHTSVIMCGEAGCAWWLDGECAVLANVKLHKASEQRCKEKDSNLAGTWKVFQAYIQQQMERLEPSEADHSVKFDDEPGVLKPEVYPEDMQSEET